MEKIKCPFCAEEIQIDAIKCRHCGEWLASPMAQNFNNKESISPDVIARGIRKAEYDKTAMGCLGIVALFVFASIYGILSAIGTAVDIPVPITP